jgi:hypothetical protein
MTEKAIYPLPGGIFADIESLLCEVSQVFDGWHQDGTAWSEYDESVRKRCAELQGKLAGKAGKNRPIVAMDPADGKGDSSAFVFAFTGATAEEAENNAVKWLKERHQDKPKGLSVDEVPGR